MIGKLNIEKGEWFVHNEINSKPYGRSSYFTRCDKKFRDSAHMFDKRGTNVILYINYTNSTMPACA